MRIPIHREGWRFIALAALANALVFWLTVWAGIAFLPFTVWCIAFFRDPERVTPAGDGLVISPADGKLLPIIQAVPPRELGMGDTPRQRLSIFMDVFNVHVNRMPVDGRVMPSNTVPASSSTRHLTRPANTMSVWRSGSSLNRGGTGARWP